jgi:hypothetical protein
VGEREGEEGEGEGDIPPAASVYLQKVPVNKDYAMLPPFYNKLIISLLCDFTGRSHRIASRTSLAASRNPPVAVSRAKQAEGVTSAVS